MADDNGNLAELLNYPPTINELQSWKGSGQLHWQNNFWNGDFVLSRLLNGRLRFLFKPHDWHKSHTFGQWYPLEFKGMAEDGSLISVTGIHFTRTYMAEMPGYIYVGYAHSASRRIDVDVDTISIRCDLTNYLLNQRIKKVEFQLGGFDIHIDRLGWGGKGSGIEEHAIAYQHASLSTCLIIEDIPSSNADQAIDCLHEVATLLSIACRGHVSIAAHHIWNEKKGRIDTLFEEPPFPDRGWGRSLIPSDNIEDFLTAVYLVDKNRIQKLELSYIVDHYLQALTLRSAWPQSVGIFTAMESLKTAFFNQNKNEENASYNYWVVPPDDFKKNKDIVQEVVEVLNKHFPRFGNLTQDEKKSLEAQIKNGLNRRSYKTQLKRVLNLLKVEYESSELQFFVDTRNRLIHEGAPVSASTPLNEYDEKSTIAWQHVKNAVSLFERALLAFLNYRGPCELFNSRLR